MALCRARSGQAMIETALAVLVITFMFFSLFKLSRLLTGKILVQHAAMRVARARAVGFNEFMCQKAARVAVIPVAGARTWPTGEDEIGYSEELARIGIYMQTATAAIARGVLDYEGWQCLSVNAGDGTESTVRLKTCWMGEEDSKWFGFDLKGKAGIERNYPFYMNDAGL